MTISPLIISTCGPSLFVVVAVVAAAGSVAVVAFSAVLV